MWEEGEVAEFGVWSLVINQGAAIGEAVFSRLASIDTVCGPLHPLPLPAYHASSPRAASRSPSPQTWTALHLVTSADHQTQSSIAAGYCSSYIVKLAQVMIELRRQAG